jgi:hypothetical protein
VCAAEGDECLADGFLDGPVFAVVVERVGEEAVVDVYTFNGGLSLCFGGDDENAD